MQKIRILLPSVIRVLRDRPHQSIHNDNSEFSLYFRNFIDPFRSEWDVEIDCAYGKNLGDCYRLHNDFPEDRDEFPLTVRVYDEYATLLGEKTVTVRVTAKNPDDEPYNVLFFGDSMTHSGFYTAETILRLYNLRSVGTRSFNGTIFLEGRGGWAMDTYFTQKDAAPTCVPSPFLFPTEIAGRDYYGDEAYYRALLDPMSDSYAYTGYRYEPIREGQYYLKEGKLFRHAAEGDTLVSKTPAFAFSFAKYMERHALPKIGAVSVLMGANDLQVCSYDEEEARVEKYIRYLHAFVESVREYDPAVRVILHLPVLGGEQYHWGVRMNCRATEKQYRHHILRAVERILEDFDGKENEGIYLCPSVAVVDPDTGYAHETVHPNDYTELYREKQVNWVHPNRTGYMQLGDALAALIQDLR